MDDIAGNWTHMWNGGLDPLQVVAPDFRIWFGARGEVGGGAAGLARFVAEHRAAHPDLVYAVHGTPALDPARGLVALTWTVTGSDSVRGGIDLLELGSDGLLARVWSVTGEQDFAF